MTFEDMIGRGLIDPRDLPALERVAARYAVAITPAMAEIVDPSDVADPIARQFVPRAEELVVTADELADPIGDRAHSPMEGLVHRYPDRVLLKITGLCPVYCRFCFRREMVGPGEGAMLGADALDAALAYIAGRPEIWEAILTGGDPLVLSDRRIGDLTRRLGEIGHVKVLRWHTRVPVVEPARITTDLVRALRETPQAVWVALHANHPRELTAEARAAIARLVDGGIAMVSQSVLLKGVNDDPATLEALMRAFVEARVKPYYLHHGDLAPGTSHFRTTIEAGRALVQTLHARASGLCQPTYVLDLPGGHTKVPIAADHSATDELGRPGFRDDAGRFHPYPPGS